MMTDRERVALFVTCLVDQVMPEIGVAAVRVLRRAGYAVDFPPDQTCCGQPFFNSGFKAEAARLARRTIEIFEEQEIVVLPSGSCTSMIRVEYPHLFADSPEWAASRPSPGGEDIRAERVSRETGRLAALARAGCARSYVSRLLPYVPAAPCPG